MTLDEAIRLQEDLEAILPEVGFNKYLASTRLLIEAGKRIKLWRQDNVYPDYALLPGETEEMEND
jgi:hypothetical protein